jgi:hypothetical protein
MDWTNLWYDDMVKLGETTLLICPNSEHSLFSGLPEVTATLANLAASIAAGNHMAAVFSPNVELRALCNSITAIMHSFA